MKVIAAICTLLVAAAMAQAKEWRGLTPLKSSRADVERLLGRPSGACHCLYDTGKEWVSVSYSGEPCADNIPYTYNVPRDTVWEIGVRPKAPPPLADLRLDLTKFERAGDAGWPFVVYYRDAEEGFVVEATACDPVVTNLLYLPAPKSELPGCTTGNGIYDPAGPIKFDEYSVLPFTEEKRHLEGLATELRDAQWWIGYVVNYAGRGERADVAVSRGERARRYLVDARGVDARRIVSVYGGYRDKPSVEIFLRPDGWREYFGEVGEVQCKPERVRRK